MGKKNHTTNSTHKGGSVSSRKKKREVVRAWGWHRKGLEGKRLGLVSLTRGKKGGGNRQNPPEDSGKKHEEGGADSSRRSEEKGGGGGKVVYDAKLRGGIQKMDHQLEEKKKKVQDDIPRAGERRGEKRSS